MFLGGLVLAHRHRKPFRSQVPARELRLVSGRPLLLFSFFCVVSDDSLTTTCGTCTEHRRSLLFELLSRSVDIDTKGIGLVEPLEVNERRTLKGTSNLTLSRSTSFDWAYSLWSSLFRTPVDVIVVVVGAAVIYL